MGVQVFSATMVLDIYADIVRSFNFVEERPGIIGNRVRVRRAPVGVVRGGDPVERAALRRGAEARPGARGGLHAWC